jgi:hypothetical protein
LGWSLRGGGPKLTADEIDFTNSKGTEGAGGGDLNVEHGSWSDGDSKLAAGVTPLWTVFHL